MKPRKYTPAEESLILRMGAARAPWEEIGRRLGRTPGNVRAKFTALGGVRPRATPNYSESDDRLILEQGAAGRSFDKIAEAVGRTRGAVITRHYSLGGKPRVQRHAGGRKKSKTKIRVCLRCDRNFPSRGIFNRICPNCSEANSRVVMEIHDSVAGTV